jgi:predicted TIM-barrel fold metal-dependent hydrolase
MVDVFKFYFDAAVFADLAVNLSNFTSTCTDFSQNNRCSKTRLQADFIFLATVADSLPNLPVVPVHQGKQK